MTRQRIGEGATLTQRSTQQVIDDHLWQRRDGSFEADLARNYDEGVVLLTRAGRLVNHDGVRIAEERLTAEVAPGAFSYDAVVVDGAVGFVCWTGQSHSGEPVHGADSFLVTNGRVTLQTMAWAIGGRRGGS